MLYTTVYWSKCLARTWICVGIYMSIVSLVRCQCYRDIITSKTSECFTDYSSHSLHTDTHTPHKLCCGVDVETLRSFCQSYKSAMRCVQGLRQKCPSQNNAITAAVERTGKGAGHDALRELCYDDNYSNNFIEDYARFRECFKDVGTQSERCFNKHLKGDSHNIKLLSTVTVNRAFCSNMKKVVHCVQDSVSSCGGAEAERLAAILVKTMVLDSTDCDYTVITEKTTLRTQVRNSANIRVGGHTRTSGNKNNSNYSQGLTAVSNLIMTMFILAISWINVFR